LLERGVLLDPNRATTRTNLGIAYSAVGRYRPALEQFREAVRIDGNRPDYRHNLGLAFQNLGAPDSALTVWTDVRRRWPRYMATARAMKIYFGSPGP
jgi:tetratricopeptide (TPR) repeat protein